MSDLRGLSTVEIDRLLGAWRESAPQSLGRAWLARHGLTALEGRLEVLDGLSPEAGLRLLECVRSERTVHENQSVGRAELVWTGPETVSTTSRSTLQVVRELFDRAQRSVLLAGYVFDHAEKILEPLHRTVQERGVKVEMFVDLEGRAKDQESIESFVCERMQRLLISAWPFSSPTPTVYYDPRTVDPNHWASLHAKCLVVDERWTLVTSANFTDRGQHRNVEMGLLVDDTALGARLVEQWRSLVLHGRFQRWQG